MPWTAEYSGAAIDGDTLWVDTETAYEGLPEEVKGRIDEENQVRFKGPADRVAFWDNRSTQHFATSDYWPRTHVTERLTIVGDRPC